VKAREFRADAVRSILVMRLYFLGDVLLSTPVIEALKRRFPDASLSLLIKKRAREIVTNNPFVDELIEYDAVERYHGPRWAARLALDLRRRRFDLAVDLTGDVRTSWLLLAIEPRYRVGFNHVGLGFLLDRAIPYRATGHGVDHLLAAVGPLGAVLEDPVPRMYLTGDERVAARALLAELRLSGGRGFLGLAPGANWAFRRWPPARFGELAARAHAELGLSSVVTGSRADSELVGEVVAASAGSALSLAGRLSVREFAAVAAEARAVVANDSGPLHIAASVGTPVVGLFGPNTPEIYGPRGAPSRIVWGRPPCSPCRQKRCARPDDPCMASITVDEVFEALRSLLSSGRLPGAT
jgi:lipopolysaccharide heptosyltransferase II